MSGSVERKRNEGFSKNSGENRTTHRTVFFKDLIDNVPSIDLARPATARLLDMIRDNTLQGRGTTDVANPVRKLGVPYESVPPHEVAVLLSKVDEGITTTEIEIVLAGFDGIPLHAVLGSKLVELRLDDRCVLRVGKKSRV